VVSGINREASRATAYSFANIKDTKREAVEMISLNGEWDFYFAVTW
jgi:beta-galactosidase